MKREVLVTAAVDRGPPAGANAIFSRHAPPF